VRVRVDDTGGTCTLVLGRGAGWPLGVSGLTEHDLRDLEFELARRRAMGRVCQSVYGEHTCSLAPEHEHGGGAHLCRACTTTWRAR